MKHLTLFLALSLFLVGAVKLDEATFKVGQRYFQQGLYSEAEKRFLEVVRKFPDSSKFQESLYLLGQSYAHMGKDKAALQYYKVLLNKSKTIVQRQMALLGIAKSWLQIGVPEKAAEFYSFYASEYPESAHTPAALYYAGIAREREGNIPAAVEKYRQIFELYPNSDYQGRAIEKVAVLDQNTPESLWQEPVRIAKAKDSPLFPEGEDFAALPGFEPAPPRAQAAQIGLPFQPLTEAPETPAPISSSPSVVTQFVPADPVVITQIVQSPPMVITQRIAVPEPEILQPAARPLPQEVQEMMGSKTLIFSNGRMVSSEAPSSEEEAKIAQYRRQWEEEQRQKEKAQKLQEASAALNQMVELTDNRESLLKVKEASLRERQNKLQSSVYDRANNINLEQTLPYRGTAPAPIPSSVEAPPAPPPVAVDPPPAAAEPAQAAPPPAEELLYPEDGYNGEDYGYDPEEGLSADIDESAAYGYGADEEPAYDEAG